jgi:hypothetical protein
MRSVEWKDEEKAEQGCRSIRLLLYIVMHTENRNDNHGHSSTIFRVPGTRQY